MTDKAREAAARAHELVTIWADRCDNAPGEKILVFKDEVDAVRDFVLAAITLAASRDFVLAASRPPDEAEFWHIAELFHENYERLAPKYSYRTRVATVRTVLALLAGKGDDDG